MSELHWIDEIADFTLADQERILGCVKCETQEVSPGVWEHTFTPQRTISISDLIHNETTASSGSQLLRYWLVMAQGCGLIDSYAFRENHK